MSVSEPLLIRCSVPLMQKRTSSLTPAMTIPAFGDLGGRSHIAALGHPIGVLFPQESHKTTMVFCSVICAEHEAFLGIGLLGKTGGSVRWVPKTVSHCSSLVEECPSYKS